MYIKKAYSMYHLTIYLVCIIWSYSMYYYVLKTRKKGNVLITRLIIPLIEKFLTLDLFFKINIKRNVAQYEGRLIWYFIVSALYAFCST